MQQRKRKFAVLAAALVLVAACGGAVTGGPTAASPSAAGSSAKPVTVADLYTAAKAEGSFSIYHAFPAQQIQQFYIDPFQKAYPGIKVENVAAGGSLQAVEAFSTEYAAGVYKADALYISLADTPVLSTKGYLASYEAINAKDITGPGLRDPKGQWYGIIRRIGAPNVNTKNLPSASYPKDWLDFVNPKPEWKGKIGMIDVKTGTFQFQWLAAMQEKFGAAKVDDILKGLKSADVKFYPANAQLTAALVSGEISVAVVNGDPFTVPAIQSGAPIDWVEPTSGWLGFAVPMVISAKAPHPNAARLWLEFFLSKEGQTAIAVGPNFPVRDGIPVQKGYPTVKATLTFDVVTAEGWRADIVSRWTQIYGR